MHLKNYNPDSQHKYWFNLLQDFTRIDLFSVEYHQGLEHKLYFAVGSEYRFFGLHQGLEHKLYFADIWSPSIL